MSKHQPIAQAPAASRKSRKRISPSRRAAAPTHRNRRSQRTRFEMNGRRTVERGNVALASRPSANAKAAPRTANATTVPLAKIEQPAEGMLSKLYMVALLVFVVPIWLPLCWLAQDSTE